MRFCIRRPELERVLATWNIRSENEGFCQKERSTPVETRASKGRVSLFFLETRKTARLRIVSSKIFLEMSESRILLSYSWWLGEKEAPAFPPGHNVVSKRNRCF